MNLPDTRTELIFLCSLTCLLGACGAGQNGEATPVPWQGGATPTTTWEPASPSAMATTPPADTTPSSGPICEQEAPEAITGAIPEAHACIHFEDGPIREVEASLRPEEAPDVSRVHTRFDVILTAYKGEFGGWVRYNSEIEGFYTLFSGTDIPVTLYGPDLEPLCAPMERAPQSCDAFMETMYLSEWTAFPIFIELGPHRSSMAQVAFEDVEVEGIAP